MFEAPASTSPNLSLIDPENPASSAMSYNSKSFNPGNPSPSVDSSSSAGIYASMGLTAMNSILNTITSVNETKAQSQIAQSIARTNARISSYQADVAIEQGNEAAARYDSKVRQQVGAIKAAQGSSGVSVNSGSSALVRSSVETAGAIDVLTIKNNAARRAWGYRVEAIQDDYRGQFSSIGAASKTQQTILAGGLEAVNGVLSIGSKYERMARYKSSGGVDEGVPFDL